jgi:hypothetical protein
VIPDGSIAKRKVRLVAGGHKQVKGLNYDETFAAAAKINSIRIILAYAAQQNWEIDQVDVVGVYLNAELDEKVFMEAPLGVLTAEEIITKVLELLKGLYENPPPLEVENTKAVRNKQKLDVGVYSRR